MALLGCFISLLFLLFLYGESLATELTGLTTESKCYWTNTSYDQECSKSRQLEVNFTNGAASGVVIAEVELPPKSCNYTKFYIILIREEKLPDNGYCTINGIGYRHSWKTYRKAKCETDKCPNICEKFTKFTFYHVQTGHYYLNVKAKTPRMNYIEYESHTKKIVTDFEKPWPTQLTNEITPSIERETVNFHFTFTRPTSVIDVILRDIDKEEVGYIHLNSSNLEHSVKKICNITLEKNDPRHVGKIRGISCKNNTSENTKRMEVYFANEDNCDSETRDNFDLRDATCLCWREEAYDLQCKDPEPQIKYTPIFIAFFAMFSILLTGIGIIFATGMLRKNRVKPITLPNDASTDTPMIISDIEILLLYPRDCPKFMALMKTFKKLLETSYHIQVHDCYDKRNHNILSGPEEWFQSLVPKVGLRTIIISTVSAYLQQEASLANIMGIYKEPEFLDHFFMYGLSHINQDFSQDVYHKIYVVQIEGFSDDIELKYLPTALTRYKLPKHLNKLLTDMSIIRSHEVTLEMDLQVEGNTYEEFIKSWEDLKLFKTVNENYLHQILNVEAG